MTMLCLSPSDSDSVGLRWDMRILLPTSQVFLLQPVISQDSETPAASINACIKSCNKCNLYLINAKHRAEHPVTQDPAISWFRSLEGLKVNLAPMREVIYSLSACAFAPSGQLPQAGETARQPWP